MVWVRNTPEILTNRSPKNGWGFLGKWTSPGSNMPIILVSVSMLNFRGVSLKEKARQILRILISFAVEVGTGPKPIKIAQYVS